MPNVYRYRARSERKMFDQAEVQSYEETGEPPTGQWTTVATFPCRVSRLGATEVATSGRIAANATASVRLPFGAQPFVESGQRLRITDGETGEVRFAEISGIPQASSALMADLQIFARFHNPE